MNRKLNSNESLEIKGMAFKLMTGMMPPFKDESPECYSGSIEARGVAYSKWAVDHQKIIRAMLASFELIMLDEEEQQ